MLLQLKGNQILATNTVTNVTVTPSINQVLGKISINSNNDELEFIWNYKIKINVISHSIYSR